jgi:hypothetical protein
VPLTWIAELADVLQITHQRDVIGTFPCACGDHPPPTSLFKKMRMALYRIPPFTPFRTDHAGSCLVDRRAMPPLTTNLSSDAEHRGNGTRKLR